MNRNWKKLLSLLLVLTMLVGMMPAVFAAEEEPEAEPEEQTDVLPAEEPADEEPEDPDEPAAGEEPVTPEEPDTPEETAEPDTSVTPENPEDPVVPEDPEVSADPEEPEAPEEPEEGEEAEGEVEEAEEESEEEEEEPVELPYGFPGMGEGYELSEEELAAKLAMADLPEAVAAMTPGVDYVADELIVAAATEEYAQQAADAFDAELLKFCDYYALIRLRSATVLQAVECAADPEIPLPAVEPNYISRSACIAGGQIYSGDFEIQGERLDWDNSGYTDTLVSNPSSPAYQYHHDILGDYAAWGASTGSDAAVLLLTSTTGSVSQLPLYNLLSDGINVPASGTSGIGVAPDASISGRTYNGTVDGLLSMLNFYAGSNRVIVVDAAFPYPNASLKEKIETLVNNQKIVIAPMGDNGNNEICYPAAYDGVIAVAATNPDGTKAAFSNYGNWCDISAPGVGLSTIGNSSQVFVSGTACAAVLVAGAAALYVSRFGTTDGFEAAMKKGATKGGIGAGIVNTANLFGGVPRSFDIGYYAEVRKMNGSVLSISEDGYFYPYFEGFSETNYGESFVYTLNGQNPAMLNGRIKDPDCMVECDDQEFIYLDNKGLELGKTYTLKVIAVSGLGVPSKVKTQKFKLVSAQSDITVRITKYPTWPINAGGSFTFEAKVISAGNYAVSQKVTWSIEQLDNSNHPTNLGAKINAKTGKLTTKAGMLGKVKVTATYETPNGTKSDTVTVSLTEKVTVKSMSFAEKSKTIDMGDGWGNVMSPTLELKDAAGNPLQVSSDGVKVCWTSSDESIAFANNTSTYLDNPIKIFGRRAGTATITATAMDGSEKTASFKVKVVQHASSVSTYYNGDANLVPSLTPGGSVKLTSYVQPGADNQAVDWSISDYGGYDAALKDLLTINPKTGQVKLNKKAESIFSDSVKSISVKVTATAQDQMFSPLAGTHSITLRPKAVSVEAYLHYTQSEPFEGCINWKTYNKQIRSVTLLSMDLPGNSVQENKLVFSSCYRDACGNNLSLVDCSSSNPSVAEVSGFGTVTLLAKAPGTSTITLASRDGLQKQKFTVKVITPISGIRLTSAAPNGTNTVAYGKSFKLKATTFSTYGKPGDTKLRWYISDVKNSNNNSVSNWENLLSISQSGVLTVKKEAGTIASPLRSATVKVAPANYGADYPSATYTVCFRDAVTDLAMYFPNSTVPLLSTIDYTIPYFCYAEQELVFTATSSNPKIATAFVERHPDTPDLFRVHVTAHYDALADGKRGTAKITVKANDGSGKSATFTVMVSNTGQG